MPTLIYQILVIFCTVVLVTAGAFLLLWFYLFRTRRPVSQAAGAEERKVLLPLRLQACERLILFLERISPGNLVMRLNRPAMPAGEFHALILKTIREEYDYNLSQQIYISTNSWELIKSAKEDMISLVNRSASRLPEHATSSDMIKAIFDLTLEKQEMPVDRAIQSLKAEVQKFF